MNFNWNIEEYEDGVCIEGPQIFQGGAVDACGDHRVAMSFTVAGDVSKNTVVIDHCENIATSSPDFLTVCRSVGLLIMTMK